MRNEPDLKMESKPPSRKVIASPGPLPHTQMAAPSVAFTCSGGTRVEVSYATAALVPIVAARLTRERESGRHVVDIGLPRIAATTLERIFRYCWYSARSGRSGVAAREKRRWARSFVRLATPELVALSAAAYSLSLPSLQLLTSQAVAKRMTGCSAAEIRTLFDLPPEEEGGRDEDEGGERDRGGEGREAGEAGEAEAQRDIDELVRYINGDGERCTSGSGGGRGDGDGGGEGDGGGDKRGGGHTNGGGCEKISAGRAASSASSSSASSGSHTGSVLDDAALAALFDPSKFVQDSSDNDAVVEAFKSRLSVGLSTGLPGTEEAVAEGPAGDALEGNDPNAPAPSDAVLPEEKNALEGKDPDGPAPRDAATPEGKDAGEGEDDGGDADEQAGGRMTPQEVVEAMKAADGRSSMDVTSLSGLSARVLTHDAHADVTAGSLDSGHFAFCAGPGWLHSCLAPGRTQRDWLLDLGFEGSWLARKIREEGKAFTLLVFRPAASRGFVPTWANVFDVALPAAFPGEQHAALRARVLAHRDALKATPFDEIEKLAVVVGCPNIRSGADGHGHLTAEQYMAAPDTLVNCRRFLRKEFKLTPLFGGDGTTVKEDGSIGFRELMVINAAVADLPELAVLPLSSAAVLGEQ